MECLLINAPSTDISEEEKDMLTDFLEGGGRVLILSGTNTEDELPNLKAVAEYYGISVHGGRGGGSRTRTTTCLQHAGPADAGAGSPARSRTR